jgi:L-malate glycosyltransferase
MITPYIQGVLLVAPTPPPYGGMALQAALLEKLLRADGVPVALFSANFPLPGCLRMAHWIPGLRTSLRALLIWPKLWVAIRKVEIIHIFAASWWYFFGVVYPAVLLGWLCGKRVILNYRGGEAERFFRWFGWATAPAFHQAHVITAPSGFLAGVISQHFCASVSIVPNILDSSAFTFRPRARLQPKILVTRHLEPLYDVESVLRAFGLIQEMFPEASLWIAGTGSQERYLRGRAAAWNLRNVCFLGNIAHGDLPAVYDQCDVYLNASLIDNFPGALIEASAAGLVVVSTDSGGIPYIYENGKTALLAKPGDWRTLGLAVQKLLSSPALALNLANAALAVARACDWREVRESLYVAYGFAGACCAPDSGGIPCGLR